MKRRLGRGLERGLGAVPDVVAAGPRLGAVGELDRELREAEIAVDARQEVDEAPRLRLDLVLGAEDMRVVLHEAAHPHDPVQRARGLVAVARPELGHAQRQVAVALEPLVEDLHVAGAVHRLERVDGLFTGVLLVDLDDEHVVLVLVPVARRLPQLAVHHLRRVDLDIAAALLLAAHVVLQRGVDVPAVRVPEDLARRLLLHVKQVHLAAQTAMVAPLGLLEEIEIGLEPLAVLEGDAVDALQHLAAAVAAPIGARDAHQLEGIRGHLPGMLEMRAAAEILPVPVPVHAQRLVAGDRLDQLDLEGLAAGLVMRDGAIALPDLGGDRVAPVDDLLHPRLDAAEILRREGLGAVEIVVPAVLDDGADGDLHLGPDFLHGAGHDMGEVVADELQRGRLVLHGVDRDGRVMRDRPLQIPVLPVDMRRDRLLAQRGRDVGRHLGGGHAGGIIARGAVRQCQGNIGHVCGSSSVWRPRNARLRVW